MNPQQLLINGAWCDAEEGGTIPIVNPNDGLPVGTLARGTNRDIDKAVAAANKAFQGSGGKCRPWKKGGCWLVWAV